MNYLKISFVLILVSLALQAEEKTVVLDVSKIESGQCIVVGEKAPQWGYIVCRRSQSQIKHLQNVSSKKLADFHDKNLLKSLQSIQYEYGINYANKIFYFSQHIDPDLRSIDSEFFVAHKMNSFGCLLEIYDNKQKRASHGGQLKDQPFFMDPCIGEVYDLAGRIYVDDRIRDKWNLRVPPYHIANGKIIIGEADNLSIPRLFDFSPVAGNLINTKRDQLALAIQWSGPELVKSRINSIGDLDYFVGDTNYSLIVFTVLLAPDKYKYEYTALLIENAADVDFAAKGEPTALYYAVKNNNVDIVKLLLKSGADPMFKVYSTTIYDYAKSKGNNKIIKIFESDIHKGSV